MKTSSILWAVIAVLIIGGGIAFYQYYEWHEARHVKNANVAQSVNKSNLSSMDKAFGFAIMLPDSIPWRDSILNVLKNQHKIITRKQKDSLKLDSIVRDKMPLDSMPLDSVINPPINNDTVIQLDSIKNTQDTLISSGITFENFVVASAQRQSLRCFIAAWEQTGADGAAIANPTNGSSQYTGIVSSGTTIKKTVKGIPEFKFANTGTTYIDALDNSSMKFAAGAEHTVIAIMGNEDTSTGTMWAKNDKALGKAEHALFLSGPTAFWFERYGGGGALSLSPDDQYGGGKSLAITIEDLGTGFDKATLVVNGVQRGTANYAHGDLVQRNENWYIGVQKSGGSFTDLYNGTMRAFMVFDELLDDATILAITNEALEKYYGGDSVSDTQLHNDGDVTLVDATFAGAATGTLETTLVNNSNASLKIYGPVGNAWQRYQRQFNLSANGIVSGDEVFISFDYNIATLPATCRVEINTDNQTNSAIVWQNLTDTSGWVNWSDTVTVPSGKSTIDIWIFTNYANSGAEGTVFLDNLVVSKVP